MFLKSIVVLMLVAFPLVADAQSRGRGQQSRGRSPRAEALAPPPGLAEMLLPAGSRRPPTVRFDGRHDDWRRWPQESRGWWRQQQFGRQPFGSFYAVPYTGFSQYAPGEVPETYAPPAAPAVPTTKGLVRLEVTPAIGLEYYVDGVFIGQSSQLGTQFEMNAGARQIELRAPGYKSLVFDARIDEGRVTTLRGTLEAIAPAQAPRNPGSRVMYVIPGCYIGNAKPEPSALPAGCDLKKMITRGAGL
jgi:hypothetical protein